MDSTTLASFAYCNHIAVLLTQSVRLQSGQISLIRTEESVPAIFLFPQDKAHTHTHTHTHTHKKKSALLNVSNTVHTVKAAQAGELTSSQSSFYLLLSRGGIGEAAEAEGGRLQSRQVKGNYHNCAHFQWKS